MINTGKSRTRNCFQPCGPSNMLTESPIWKRTGTYNCIWCMKVQVDWESPEFVVWSTVAGNPEEAGKGEVTKRVGPLGGGAHKGKKGLEGGLVVAWLYGGRIGKRGCKGAWSGGPEGRLWPCGRYRGLWGPPGGLNTSCLERTHPWGGAGPGRHGRVGRGAVPPGNMYL